MHCFPGCRSGGGRPPWGRGRVAGWRFWRRGAAAPRRLPAAPDGATGDAPPAQRDYGELCQSAGELLASGRAAEAAAEARQALKLLPRGLEAQRTLGLALLELGEYRQALSALTSALACDPQDVVAQVGVAEATEALQGAAEAEPAWQRAWEIEPGLAEVEERLQAARRAAGALDHLDGAPAYTRAALARVYLRGGMYEHAAAEAAAGLAREPERPELQLVLAEAHWRAGDLDSAAAVAGTLLERYPDCVAANLLVAAQWQTMGRDPAPLVARVRAVDPAGRIAARLFDDRELPAALEEITGELPIVEPVAANPAVPDAATAAAMAEPAVPPPARPEPAATAAPAWASVYRGTGWIGGPVAAATGRGTPEPEALEPGTHPPSPTLAPLLAAAAAPAAIAPPSAEPHTDRAGVEPAPPPPDQPPPGVGGALAALPSADREAAAAARAQGDALMRAGRYREALRAYGAALRALRLAEVSQHEAA